MKKLLSLLLVIVFTYGSIQRMGEAKSIEVDNKRVMVLSPISTSIPDSRIKAVKSFFESYGSDMAENSKDFIEASDIYKINYKLLPAIAGVESTFGKFTPGCAGFNPFGWTSSTSPCGFYRFSSYREAIFFIAKGISRNQAYFQWQKTGEVIDLAQVYNAVAVEKVDFRCYLFHGSNRMNQYQCPRCSYPVDGIVCPNCKKQFPTGELKVKPVVKPKKKPVIN